jgi:imidazoleglycerol-phosphate dehydratase/histidinol-phosphatase
MKMKKALLIDRDGVLIVEPSVNEQVVCLEKLEFFPKVFRNLHFIRHKLDFDMVMVIRQEEAGTESFPEDSFRVVQNRVIQTFANEDVHFDDIRINCVFPCDYDPERSFVIGDRLTDMETAKNIGCKGILFNDCHLLDSRPDLKETCVLATADWDRITEFLYAGGRTAVVQRKTRETDIHVSLNMDGNGKCDISTGLGFFDHLLEQIGKHSGIDLNIRTRGDLQVDEHHTIEDTAIALGEALHAALGDKRGIERYGFCLPMDDCLCSVALDFGGRPWLVWDGEYRREKIGDMPTEMFLHFFKSLSDAAKMNLNIKAEGSNEHHKIEGTFKAFARALKMAVRRDIHHLELPSTKGVL